jgi:hypothetical protein
MTLLPKFTAAALLIATLAGCAPTVQSFDPPPTRPLDAKTTLETGRR